MREEQAIFNLEIKKKSGLSLNPDVHHSKVFSSDQKNGRKCIFLWIQHHFFLDRNAQFTFVEKPQNNKRNMEVLWVLLHGGSHEIMLTVP